jgi:Ser/Thr protein kinase RdoA (MazF antagonist)
VIPLFPFVAAGHPFHARLESLRSMIDGHGRALEWTGAGGNGRATIHAEIKALPAPQGGWLFDRFYWSRQTWDGPPSRPFRAITLSYAAKTDQTEWYEFPEDSYLTTMAGFFGAGSAPVEVLRYVPLRRLTFRAADVEGRAIIGKFKRRSRFCQAHELLGLVADAVGRAAPGFAVSRPLAIDGERCLYYQSALSGENLADLIREDNCAELLHAVGSLHGALHGVEAPGAPAWDREAFLAGLRRDCAWIGMFEPQQGPLLAAVRSRLEAQAPEALAGPPVFCHGDFVCSQILVGEEGWSVTDFDLCHIGDPYRDMAILLASLPYDVPLLRDAAGGARPGTPRLLQTAAEAYLEGYRERTGRPLDRLRLIWHRIAAEIYYLALMLKKDQFSRTLADHRLGLIRMLAAGLEESRDSARRPAGMHLGEGGMRP